MSFNFKSQLRLGALGETLFFEANCKDLIRLDGRGHDFVHKDDAALTYELKTDTWAMDQTQNFFFERYSDAERKTPGGPWQSKARFFVYFYVTDLTYFQFETADLVAALEDIIPTIKPTEVQNKSWTTVGYRVPRSMVEHLAKTVRLTAKKARGKFCS